MPLLPRASLPLVATLATAGCNLDNPGLDPPIGEVHFPLGVLLVDAPNGDELVIVGNSNFDASYNAGSLQVWDRAAVAAELADCAEPPRPEDCPRALDERTLVSSQETRFLLDEVWIPPVAWEVALGPAGARLYVAVEGRDGDVTYADFDADGRLASGQGYLGCGQGRGRRCSGRFAKADPGLSDERDLDPTTDQKTLAVGDSGAIGLPPGTATFIFVAERRGNVELLVDQGTVPGIEGVIVRPTLLDVIGPLNFQTVEVAFDARTGLAWLANPDVRDPLVQRVGVSIDPAGERAPTLFTAMPATVRGAGVTSVIRDIAFATSEEAEDRVVLLSGTDAAGNGNPALFFAQDPDPSTGFVDIRNVVPVCGGPSRLERATLVGRELYFVSCFNGRRVDVVDAVTELQLTSLRDAGGIYDMAVDAEGQKLWIGDFERSSVRLADLSSLARCIELGLSGDQCEPRILGSIGVPTRTSEL